MKKLTKLSPEEEELFRNWYSGISNVLGLSSNPDDKEHYYDYRGYWKEMNDTNSPVLFSVPSADYHFPDTYKLPGHATFSRESKYFDPNIHRAGRWENGNFVMPKNTYDDLVNDRYDMAHKALLRSGYSESDAVRLAPILASQSLTETGWVKNVPDYNYAGYMQNGKKMKFDSPDSFWDYHLNNLSSKWPDWSKANDVNEYVGYINHSELGLDTKDKYKAYKADHPGTFIYAPVWENKDYQKRMQSVYNNRVSKYMPSVTPGPVSTMLSGGGRLHLQELAQKILQAGYYRDGGKIHIKPSHRGRLTELKERTGKSEAELYNDGNPAHKKMVVFARNARKWKHEDGGLIERYGVDAVKRALQRRFDNGGNVGDPPTGTGAPIVTPHMILGPLRKAKDKYLRDYINSGEVYGYPGGVLDWVRYLSSPYVGTRHDKDNSVDGTMGRRALLAKYMGITEGLDFNPGDYIEESPYSPSISSNPGVKYYRMRDLPSGTDRRSMFDAVAGFYKVGHGVDEDGRRYVSYYDLWDLSPFSGGHNKENEVPGATPIELYDRFYEDEDPDFYYRVVPQDESEDRKRSRQLVNIQFANGGYLQDYRHAEALTGTGYGLVKIANKAKQD